MDPDFLVRGQYSKYYTGLSYQIDPSTTLVIDNGAYTTKFGFADSADPMRIIPNCTAKTKKGKGKKFVGEDIYDCKDFTGMNQSRPFDRVCARPRYF